MKIAIALFQQVTALDAVGPYEVLQRLLQRRYYLSGVTGEKYARTTDFSDCR